MHGEFVASHLERGDVNGNHYLSDGVGLVFLGTFFRAHRRRAGAGWRSAERSSTAEIFNQTSEDGVDFEKSTAYHRLVLELFLTSHLLLERNGEPVLGGMDSGSSGCWSSSRRTLKPDGLVPLIGDADDGRVQKLGVAGASTITAICCRPAR